MRKTLVSFVLISVPLGCFAFPFCCGFANLSQGYLMFLLPMMAIGPLLATIVVARLLKSPSSKARLTICIGLYAAVIAVFVLGPAGAAAWTMGFAANFRLTKHPAQIQVWATRVLDRFEAGTLATRTNAEYWAAGKAKLADSEIPPNVRSIWIAKPSIGIATIRGNGLSGGNVPPEATVGDSGSVHCVAFSWYLTGMLVGRPDFKSTWNPWYIREIIPGVYAYSGIK